MRTKLFCLAFMIVSGSVFSQDTIYSIAYTMNQPVSEFEDRDTADYFHFGVMANTNIWQIGEPNKQVFNSSFSPSLALVTDTLATYPPNNRSFFEFVISTDDYTEISFWHKLNTDTLVDGGTVGVSLDGGFTWTNIVYDHQFTLLNFYDSTSTVSSNNNSPGFTGNSGWIKSLIKGYALNFVRFRFTFTSDNIDNGKDGWMIDNFDFACFGTGINESSYSKDVIVFPNPTVDRFHIKLEKNRSLKNVLVKNGSGKLMAIFKTEYVDISELPAGVYLLEIFTDEKRYFSRIEKY